MTGAKTRRRLVFVCTGNICRSPMAEYLLKSRLPEGSGWDVSSAGVAAGRGLGPSRPAVMVMKEFGVNLAGHRSRPLDPVLATSADLIVVMTDAHRREICSLYPDVCPNVYLLKSFMVGGDRGDVMDPIGLSDDVYRAVRDEIDVALSGLLAFMAAVDKTPKEKA